MKKYTIVCAVFATAMLFASCGTSKESAYRKAYEKAKAQEMAQQQGQQAYGQQQQYVQQDPAQYQQQQYQQPMQQQAQQYQQPMQQQAPQVQQYQQPMQQQAPTVTQLTPPTTQQNITTTTTTTASVNNNVATASNNVSKGNLKAFSVVVGAFGVRANAEGLQNTLRNAGYNGAQVIYDGKMYFAQPQDMDFGDNEGDDYYDIVNHHLEGDQDIEFETGVLMIIVTRRLQDRQVLKQQDRILDCIYIERELDTLCMVICIPVTQTYRSEFAIRNGLCQTTGTGFILRTVKMDHVTAVNTGRTVIHRSHFLEVVKRQGIVRRRVVDITNGVIEVEVVHTELIGIVDQFGRDRLETEEVLITFRTYDKVGLSDGKTGEVGLVTGHDLRARP